MIPTAVIVDALRTPIGRHGGALARVRPDDLAAVVIRALLERTGVNAASVEFAMTHAAFFRRAHDSCVFEDLHVFQDGAQRHVVRFGQLAHRRAPPAEPGDDVHASRVGECRKRPVDHY